MASSDKDVFGFDELEKAYERTKKKYPNEADAFLMAMGRALTRRTKQLTPVYEGPLPRSRPIKPGQLKRSWTLKKVKLYKGGTVRVVRIQSTAPHAHLVEFGHVNYRGGSSRERGRKLNAAERSARGISSHGRTEGKYMLTDAAKEIRERFNEARKIIDGLVEEWQR